MEIKLLAFGQVAELTGQHESIYNNVRDTDTLRNDLLKSFPGMDTIQYTVAVNKKVIKENTILNDGDTVALLPPFSGG